MGAGIFWVGSAFELKALLGLERMRLWRKTVMLEIRRLLRVAPRDGLEPPTQ
jgi:hypothetical protein